MLAWNKVHRLENIIEIKLVVATEGFEVVMWTNDDVYECEPFIGELPSFIKDKA